MSVNFSEILQGHHLDPKVPHALYVVDLTVNAVSSITATILNILVIVALRKIPLVQVHSVFKAFLFNLALADLAVGALVQPAYISTVVTAMYGFRDASRILGTMFYLGNWFFPNISVSFLTLIAIDRFLALHRQNQYRRIVTFKRVVSALAFLWVLKCVETFILIYDYRIYNIQSSIGLVIFVTIITASYLTIYLSLRRHEKAVRGPSDFSLQNVQGTDRPGETSSTRTPNSFSLMRYKRSVYDMLCLYLAFLFCYIPPLCVLIAIQVQGEDSIINMVRFLAGTLTLVNASLNPLLYCWRIRVIRRTVWTTVRGLFCTEVNTTPAENWEGKRGLCNSCHQLGVFLTFNSLCKLTIQLPATNTILSGSSIFLLGTMISSHISAPSLSFLRTCAVHTKRTLSGRFQSYWVYPGAASFHFAKPSETDQRTPKTNGTTTVQPILDAFLVLQT